MEFINLYTVLTGLAGRVPVHQASQFPEEVRTSEAAGLLRQTLHNVSQGRPRWVEINKISSKPEFNDAAIYPEAMGMLEHAAGWYRREVKNQNAHIASCLNAGLDPQDVALGHNMVDLPFPGAQFCHLHNIGFDRSELVAFLDDKQIDHDLKPLATAPTPESGPKATTPSPAPEPPGAPVAAALATSSKAKVAIAEPVPVVTGSASGAVEERQSNLPWWQVAYDIHDMAQNIGARLQSEQKQTSNTAIAKEIEKRINDIERSKGRDRCSPNWDTIRGVLTGRVWRPE